MVCGPHKLGWIFIDATLATTLFLTFTVLILLIYRQPAKRVVVAQAAILTVVLMVVLAMVQPLPRVHVRSWFPSPAPRQTSPSTEFETPFETETPNILSPRSFEHRMLAVTRRVLIPTYLTGVSLSFLWLLFGYGGMRRLIAGASPPGPETEELYNSIVTHENGSGPEHGHDRTIPRLLISPRIRKPVVGGIMKPSILLPSVMDQPEFDRDSLRIVLIHELAHVSQRDVFYSMLASIVQALWFFLPYVWWIRAQLRIDQEFLADRLTADQTGSPAGYATRLVNLASLASSRSTPGGKTPPSAITDAPPSWRTGDFETQLLQRVVMLLHAPFQIEPRAPRWWRWMMPMLIYGVGLGTSSLTLKPPPAPDHVQPSSSHSEPAARKRSFRVAQFTASPQAGGRTGSHPLPYILPLPLPEKFTLTADVQASYLTLAQMRLAGILLDVTSELRPKSDGSPINLNEVRTHKVRIERDGSKIALHIDGLLVPFHPGDNNLPHLFTIVPPLDATIQLRNLEVVW